MTKNTDAKAKTPTWAKRKPLNRAQLITQLEEHASAAYAAAKATTGDSDVRAGLMDRAHMLREAVRLLG